MTSHLLGIHMAEITIGLMRAVSDFALAVRAQDVQYLPYFRGASYAFGLIASLTYLWPIIRYSLAGYRGAASAVVQRRVLSTPLVLAGLGFAPWVFGPFLFVGLTLYRFGHWSPELISQHIFSPLVAGFLASTTSYVIAEWIMRAQFVPRVFPEGRLSGVRSAWTLGVRARLAVLVVAVAFTPLFTMLGLVSAAEDRVATGLAIDEVLAALVAASRGMFVFYLGLGSALTLLLARSLTHPLGVMSSVLRRVEAGDLDAQVKVTSVDEIGVLEEGVNAMVDTLREREHILQTFGRVVEPDIRDRLLSGDLRAGGERRVASVLFADLRGFTTLAEQHPPEVVVATLNRFFTTMTGWVRDCGGFVDKFIGDAMLVVFGLFDESSTNATTTGAAAAVRCAVGMRDRLAVLNAQQEGSDGSTLSMSVGVHTGEVLAGTIGATDRHEYTVIGDTVNVAARLQQLCKDEGRDVLASAECFQMAREGGYDADGVPEKAVRLRGRTGEVGVVVIT
jgi:adenylate cyclase